MKALLTELIAGRDLDESRAAELLGVLTSEDVPEATKGALLAAHAAKGPTGPELRGLARGMREAAVPVEVPADGAPLVDTCGTGGDGSDSFNVSTATSILAAAAGCRVVKHGNRSVSSRSGSADVLEALGLTLAADADTARSQLAGLGYTFLFAPNFHPAMKAVVPVRRALGVRTAFNLLGPLSNPAAPPFQLLGAYSPEAARLLADALSGLPIERAFVVHGDPGWDEATPCGPFLRLEVRPGSVTELEVDPRFTYGLKRRDPAELAGGDAAHNARMMEALMHGTPGAVRDAVVLNTALVLELAGVVDTPKQGREAAEAALDDGRGAWFLDRLKGWSP